ncbi:hypothetical protein [Lentilactobacillus otakiensis]|uniref:hypothetical protein n=1 Tax=Lentilactobacillus otakiensis TaxID=481720 RepID=UPI003D169F51
MAVHARDFSEKEIHDFLEEVNFKQILLDFGILVPTDGKDDSEADNAPKLIDRSQEDHPTTNK